MARRDGSDRFGRGQGRGPGENPARSPYTRGRSGGFLSWAWVVLGIVCGIGLVVLGIRDGHLSDVLVGVLIVAICVVLSRPSRQAIARKIMAARPQPDSEAPVVVYWRSDDLNSLRLRSSLKDVRDRIVWINCFYYAEAENTVRQANRGDEVLPTVMIDGVAHTDPAPDVVRAAVEELR